MDGPLPWAEKYRPKRLGDVLGNDRIVEALQLYSRLRHPPNLLFVGPPGCGKTSAAASMLHEMGLPPDAVLRLNASDDRGPDAVRQTVGSFVAGTSASGRGTARVALLDEADGMTHHAQLALKATMERHARRRITFVLCANSEVSVHPGIVSRSVTMRFRAVPTEVVERRLKDVAATEGLGATAEQLAHVALTSGGDLRTGLNALQVLGLPARRGIDPSLPREVLQPPSLRAVLRALSGSGTTLQHGVLLTTGCTSHARDATDRYLQLLAAARE